MTLLQTFATAFTLGRVLLALFCLRCNELLARLVKAMFRKRATLSFVVIGDGFAEGFGDIVTGRSGAGLCYHLQNKADRDKRLRATWAIHNRGHFASSIADWLPSSGRPGRFLARLGVWSSLFQANREYLESAAVVCILLGTGDARSNVPPKEAAATMEALVRVLLERLKPSTEIIICPPRNAGGKENSCEIEEVVKKLAKEFRRVTLGPNVNRARWKTKDFSGFDGIHLNADGYRELAVAIYEASGVPMRRAEYVWAETELGGF